MYSPYISIRMNTWIVCPSSQKVLRTVPLFYIFMRRNFDSPSTSREYAHTDLSAFLSQPFKALQHLLDPTFIIRLQDGFPPVILDLPVTPREYTMCTTQYTCTDPSSYLS